MSVIIGSISINEFLLVFFLSLFAFVFGTFLGSILLKHKFDLFRYGSLKSMASEENQSYVGNFALMVIWPSLFLTLICDVFQLLNQGQLIYVSILIIPLYWIVRFLQVVFMQRIKYIRWGFHIISCLCSLAFGVIVWKFFIIRLYEYGLPIGLPLDEFRNALWFAIICLIIKMIWELVSAACSEAKLDMRTVVQSGVTVDYEKFKEKYDDFIEQCIEKYSLSNIQKAQVKTLVYALIIYENYNRPRLIRLAEHIVACLRIKKAVTQGVAQFPADSYLSDKDSIELRIKDILNRWNGKDFIICNEIVDTINNRSDYLQTIEYIADIISEIEYGRKYREIVCTDSEEDSITSSRDTPKGIFDSISDFIADGKNQQAIGILQKLEEELTPLKEGEFSDPLFELYSMLEIAFEELGDSNEAEVYKEKAKKVVLNKKLISSDANNASSKK